MSKGLIWNISNGLDVNLWNDLWISNAQKKFRLLLRSQDPPPQIYWVHQIIDPVSKTWDLRAIKIFILPEMESLILRFPLSYSCLNDKLIWRLDKKKEGILQLNWRIFWLLIKILRFNQILLLFFLCHYFLSPKNLVGS